MTFGVSFLMYSVLAALQYGNAVRFGTINPNLVLLASALGFVHTEGRERWMWFAGAFAALGVAFALSHMLWLHEVVLSLVVIAAMGLARGIFRKYEYAAAAGLVTAGTFAYDVCLSLMAGIPVVWGGLALELLVNGVVAIALWGVWKKMNV